MMFKHKFIACIKVKGKILREFKDKVVVPFGSEYSILLKNLSDQRALATVTIDGTVMAEGLVVNAHSELDLERSIANGNMSQGNRFKFIERTESIEQHRGIGATDGLVEVQFAYEYRAPLVLRSPRSVQGPWYPNTVYGTCSPIYNASVPLSNTTVSATAASYSNDVGITVPGSVSDQQFQTVAWFATGPAETMVLHLVGHLDNQPVEKPILVSSKPKCVTCGRTNKSSARFCSHCGTGLVIVA